MTATITANKPDLATTLQNAVASLNQVIQTQPDSDRLLAEMVRLSGCALGAGGAGVWITDKPDRPELILEHNLQPLGFLTSEAVLPGLLRAVRRSAREGKSLIVPPFFVEAEAGDTPVNPSPLELLFVPMKLHGKVAMILLVAIPPAADNDIDMHRTCLNFLARMVNTCEANLTERHLTLIEKDRGTSSKLVRFTDEIHKHLFVQQTATDIANLGRDVLDADRVTVELYPRMKKKVIAVSNVAEPNKRAAVFQLQRLLFDYVRDRQVPVVLDRQSASQLVSDPMLQDAATAYFSATEFEAFLAAPIKSDDAKSTILGVVLAEYVSTQKAQLNSPTMADVARLSTRCVLNSLDHESIPFRKTLHAVRKLFASPFSTKKKAAITLAAVALVVCTFLCVVPLDNAIRADCLVRPSAQLTIAAPSEQRIIEIPVRTGEHVYPLSMRPQLGDKVKPLAIFDTTELIASRAEQVGKTGELHVQLKEAERRGEIAKLGGIKLQIEQVEKQIALLDHQIAQSTVWSPIEGTVITEKIEGKKWSVPRKSEPLMEVASFADWELVVDVPENEVASVQAALLRAQQNGLRAGHDDQGIPIEYVLYPWPDQRYSLRAKGVASVLPASMQSKQANVFRLQVKLDPQSLPPGLSMSGVTGRAKIHVGTQPLAQQWTRGAARLLRMTIFF